MKKYHYNWQNFTSEDKKYLRSLKPIFILAPREMSEARLKQILREYLPKHNIILGVADEEYVDGFDGQPQFRTLRLNAVEGLVKKTAAAQKARMFATLSYPQSVTDDVIRKLKPARVLVVRGSYQYVFHRRSTWHVLRELGIPFDYVSPFCDEKEARGYLSQIEEEMSRRALRIDNTDDVAMLELAHLIGRTSFDYSFQTGCVMAESTENGYRAVLYGYNAVVPYQTYALHYGNSREDHESPPHDANYYDTIHAEMNVLLMAMQTGQTFESKTMFIPLLPCPNCARTVCQSGIAEVVYERDHSDGYAIKLFESCGIATRKVENEEAAI